MIDPRELINQFGTSIAGGRNVQATKNGPGSALRRKTGTATNSRLWNWIAGPGLPPRSDERRRENGPFLPLVKNHGNILMDYACSSVYHQADTISIFS